VSGHGFDPGAFRAGQRRGDKDVTTIDLGEDAAPDPAVTAKLAAALPEITRALVRMTVSRESLDPDALRAVAQALGESAALSRSLLEQMDGWVQREQAGGRLEWDAPGIPAERLATVAGIRLRAASSAAGELAGFLGWAQVVLAGLRAADPGTDAEPAS
jgi:hypothetical protein